MWSSSRRRLVTATPVRDPSRPPRLQSDHLGAAAGGDRSSAPPPPPGSPDDHRFCNGQPRITRFGSAVHLHVRSAAQVASGILITRIRATRTAPADADRVDDDQPRSGERLGRAVKLHQSSWGHAEGDDAVLQDALHEVIIPLANPRHPAPSPRTARVADSPPPQPGLHRPTTSTITPRPPSALCANPPPPALTRASHIARSSVTIPAPFAGGLSASSAPRLAQRRRSAGRSTATTVPPS